MSIRNLDELLRPKSVALIGASSTQGSLGALIWNNLTSAGFLGPLYAVNLKHKSLGDFPIYRSVNAIAQTIDLAIICTPPKMVVDLIAELGQAGVKAVIVITAGMSHDQKQAMLSTAKPYLLRVLGPNCLGIISPKIGLNGSFSQTNSLPGDLAFISQSGALATGILDWAKFRGLGFSHLVSLGEGSDVDFADLLDMLATDSSTKAIILYVESITLARKFMSAARAAARNKPVIVLKSGRSEQGAIAAASHSGALAGSDMVFDAAIKRAGMLRVETLQELFVAAMALTRRGNRDNKHLAILTNGGGAGVIAADWAARLHVALTVLSSKTVEEFDKFLPPNWSKNNPIDIIGDAPILRYQKALEALLATRDDSLILLIHAPTAMVSSKEIAQACLVAIGRSKDRIMSCWLGDESVREARDLFRQAGIADYATPEEAVAAFSMLQRFWRHQELLLEVPSACVESIKPDLSAIRSAISEALAAGRSWLSMTQAFELLNLYGIKTPKFRRTIATKEAVLTAASELGYPLALKVDSEKIQHKFDVGGVCLDLNSEVELEQAFDVMLASIHKKFPELVIEHFIVQVMVKKKNSIELILGSYVDALFGPVILFGQGGTGVEVIKDRAIAIPPLNTVLANELISSTQVSRQFVAFRGQPAVDTEGVAASLVALSALLAAIPEISEIDINPFCVDSTEPVALDARVRISALAPSGSSNFSILAYPDELVESILWAGENIVLRPIRPEDESQHRLFLEQLTPEDIRMRIFFTKRELPRSELARLTQIDYSREMAFIAERESEKGAKQTLAAIRMVCDPEGFSGEFALVVRSDLKRQGLGRIMLNKAIRYAKERGLRQMVGTVLRENNAMRELVSSAGFVNDTSAPIEREATNVVLKF
jgi:acetyltransferase